MEILAREITEAVSKLCMEANYFLNKDIETTFKDTLKKETNERANTIVEILLENAQIARDTQVPICQDTGMAVVFVEIGQDVRVVGNLTEAINAGVADGYEKGYLRKSIVKDPIDRINTKDNTPAVIHYDIVPGDKLKIIVAPKGFGSENMSGLKMLKPSEGIEGVKAVVIDTVLNAGSNPCPPIIVGVGVGGTMEKACLIAKRALLREIGSKNENPFWNGIEQELLDAINKSNIGPAGMGGILTAMAVHINTYPTHIAGLPVAVNIGCHVTRHAEVILG